MGIYTGTHLVLFDEEHQQLFVSTGNKTGWVGLLADVNWNAFKDRRWVSIGGKLYASFPTGWMELTHNAFHLVDKTIVTYATGADGMIVWKGAEHTFAFDVGQVRRAGHHYIQYFCACNQWILGFDGSALLPFSETGERLPVPPIALDIPKGFDPNFHRFVLRNNGLFIEDGTSHQLAWWAFERTYGF